MMSEEVLLKSFALGGYRSFGAEVQRFEKLAKINLFIGQNNSGKSNILRFVHDVYPKITARQKGVLSLNALDRHLPSHPPFRTGLLFPMEKNKKGEYVIFNQEVIPKFPENLRRNVVVGYALRVFENKMTQSDTKQVWFDFNERMELIDDDWEHIFSILSDSDLHQLWNALSGVTGGSRKTHWYPESLRKLTPSFQQISAVMIPAIRQIGKQG
jgi:energy-coupling factor transporter ATP-binding protein EcfA2